MRLYRHPLSSCSRRAVMTVFELGIAGDTLTLADLSISAELSTMERAQLPLDDFQHVQAWFARITRRDAWNLASA